MSAASLKNRTAVAAYHADDTTLFGLIGDCTVGQANVHLLHIVGRCVDASHDTLVVPLKEDSDQGEDLDGNVELRRRQLLP